MEQLNIVELIESNPITKLTNTYNSKLLNKIKENFTGFEQQLFISSFYCYLNYDKTLDFEVDLDNIWKWLGFSQKVDAKRLLEKHFVIDKDYKNFALGDSKANLTDENSLINFDKQKNGSGGQNIKKIMLTIKCFKSLCLKSQTKKASEIHEYYMKMEEILHETLEEEGTELKDHLKQQKLELDQKTIALKTMPEMEKHKILLSNFAKVEDSLVYVIRVKKNENGSYIVRIGESREGVEKRFKDHKKSYGNGSDIIILDCFLVSNSGKFERFLHKHKDIRPSIVKDLIGHEKENELFLIDKDLSYTKLLEIIKTNINDYDCSSKIRCLNLECENLKLENENLKLIKCNNNTTSTNSIDENIINELVNSNKILLQKIENLEISNKEIEKSNKEIISKLMSMEAKTHTKFGKEDSHTGPRLQMINSENLQQIVKVYESVADCCSQNVKNKPSSISKAVKENTVYNDYRWAFVDRSLYPYTIQQLDPTKITRLQNLGYIAKINKEKTKILNVYLDRKSAYELNKPNITLNALENAVKDNKLLNENYYMLYDKCSNDLKDNFCKNEFLLYKTCIEQRDTENIVIKQFMNKSDCYKNLFMSEKNLNKSLDKNLPYNNCYFITNHTAKLSV